VTPEPSAIPEAGDEFAYAKPDGTVWLSDAYGTSQREMISEPPGVTSFAAAASAQWSPDGRYLAYSTPRGTLELLEIDSGLNRVLDGGEDGLVAGIDQWSSTDTISYSKATTDPSVPGGKAPWTVTIDGKKSPTPGEGHIEDGGGYCWLSAPSGGLVLCRRRTDNQGSYGVQLYLTRPGSGEEQLITEHGEFHSWSPDSRWLAYYDNARGGSTITGEIHIREIETGRDIELGTFNSDDGARWAPSRDRLIFDNLEIDRNSGAVKELFERPFTGVSWSPDLSKAEFINGGGTLVELDLDSGTRTELLRFSSFDAHRRVSGLAGPGSAWSPDSRYLAFLGQGTATDGERVLYTLDTASGAINEVLRATAVSMPVVYAPDSSRLLIGQETNDGVETISTAEPDGSSLTAVAEGVLLREPWRPASGAKK
jgi:Tol biopolymer transport system component